MQNAVDMDATSILKTFNTATFTPIYLKNVGNSSICADPTGKVCNQFPTLGQESIPANEFQNFEFQAGNVV